MKVFLIDLFRGVVAMFLLACVAIIVVSAVVVVLFIVEQGLAGVGLVVTTAVLFFAWFLGRLLRIRS